MLRWNFSSRARDLSGADAIVVSVPKSGRTWVRTFLSAYFCRLTGRDFILDPPRDNDGRISRVIFTHDVFENATKGSWWDRCRGKYLIPPATARDTRIIMLARDPRDTLVSLHAHVTRRDPDVADAVRQMDLSTFLHDERFGIGAIVKSMNGWVAEFGHRKNFYLVQYEALRSEPRAGFARLVAFITGYLPVDTALDHALAFSDFDHMQQMEAAGEFDSTILRPGDPADRESFKVRRGKIGGFADCFSEEDLRYANAVCAKLDSRFPYTF